MEPHTNNRCIPQTKQHPPKGQMLFRLGNAVGCYSLATHYHIHDPLQFQTQIPLQPPFLFGGESGFKTVSSITSTHSTLCSSSSKFGLLGNIQQGVLLGLFPCSPCVRTKFPYCKRRKAGQGLGTRLACCHDNENEVPLT